MSLKTDAEKEITRITYILKHYKCSEKERSQMESYLVNAKKVRDQNATKKEVKGANT